MEWWNLHVTTICSLLVTLMITGSIQKEAAQVCRNWGYEGAQSVGGYGKHPGLQYSGQIRMAYQCIGDLEE